MPAKKRQPSAPSAEEMLRRGVMLGYKRAYAAAHKAGHCCGRCDDPSHDCIDRDSKLTHQIIGAIRAAMKAERGKHDR